MLIDPHAWIATVPLTLFLVAVYFQSGDHPLKRMWEQIRRLDEDVWNQLGFYELAQGSRALHSVREAAYWMSIGALCCGSLLSFASFTGWFGV